MAQYECFTQDMYNHQEDIAKYAALEGLAAEGVYALAEGHDTGSPARDDHSIV